MPGVAVAPEEPSLAVWVMALRLAVALALGLAVAGVYLVSQRRTGEERGALGTTIVLLTILVAMTTLVIGDNIARAFGLVALSIVRFRTVVEDTRDTAFVIFAVVVGMAIGAGYFAVALIGAPLVAATAIGLSLAGSRFGGPAQQLQIRLATGSEPGPALEAVLARNLARCQLASAGTARQGAALDLTYRVQLRDPLHGTLPLLKELNQTEGVQSVELKTP